MSSHFPIFYRAVFVLFDVLLPLFGIYSHLFNPDFILQGFTSKPVTPPAAETILLLDTLAGWYAALVLLQLVFLRYRPNDLVIWRTLEGATLLVDLFMLGGFARELRSTGRGSVNLWRGEDWGNVGGYVLIAVIRLAFIIGLGFGKDKTQRKKA